jgi:hypothetical protein
MFRNLMKLLLCNSSFRIRIVYVGITGVTKLEVQLGGGGGSDFRIFSREIRQCV